jgi:hypothetical protein
MKWKVKYPTIGDTRIIKRFLFLPRCIEGEVRWLEFVKIKQMYKINYMDADSWYDIAFVD